MPANRQAMDMDDERFIDDVRLIVSLTDELNVATDWQRQNQQWCIDRIKQLRFLYAHMQEHFWPIRENGDSEFEASEFNQGTD